MLSKALISRNEGNRSEVLVMRAEACGTCHACNNCNAKPTTHWVENSLQAQEGQSVLIEMEDGVFFRNIFLLYGLPVLFFLGGVLLSTFIQGQMGRSNEVIDLLAGFVGLLLFWVVIRQLNARQKDASMMHMVRILSQEELLAPVCGSQAEGVNL